MSGLKVVDDTTFTIKTSEPVSNLPVRLGYSAFAPLPDSFFNDPKAFEKKPIGAGPFKVDTISNTEYRALQVRRLLRREQGERRQADLPDLPGPGGGLHRRGGRQPRLHRRQQHPAATSSSATPTRPTSRTATSQTRVAGRSAGSRSRPNDPQLQGQRRAAQGHLDGHRPGPDHQADLQRHPSPRPTAGCPRWWTATRPTPAVTPASSTRRRPRRLSTRPAATRAR